MSVINKMRRQYLVYWEKNLKDLDNYGKWSYKTPVVLDCRWEEKIVDVALRDGSVFTSQAIVYMENPPSTESYILLLGDDDNGGIVPTEYQTGNPESLKQAWKIRHVEVLPKLKNNQKLITIYV